MERLSILYAIALFDIAVEQNAVDAFHREAMLIRDSLQDAEVKNVLLHPQISVKEKHELFKKAYSGKINEALLGFLYLAAEKNREAYVIPALDQLIENIDRHNNKIKADVLTAAEYDKKQIQELKAILSEKLGKQVEIDLRVDPSVIGGPFIYADGYYIDWTVKKRLRDMTRSMKEGCNA